MNDYFFRDYVAEGLAYTAIFVRCGRTDTLDKIEDNLLEQLRWEIE